MSAEVIIAVMSWAAKMERLATAERISAARERIEAEGGRWGRPSRVDRRTRERAAAMRNAGKTIRQIARDLKVPRSAIARALACSPP
jgi:DNA invertase Pin-like site-specific DNA recombinase